MGAAQVSTAETGLSPDVTERVKSFDWKSVSQDLDARGSAILEHLLSPHECQRIAALYTQDELFRSRVEMGRHGFGRGEYKYFSYPLPSLIAQLRTAIYPHLVPIANRWNAALGINVRYPEEHADFLERCHQAGQLKPTPLVLQYGADDNRRPGGLKLGRDRNERPAVEGDGPAPEQAFEFRRDGSGLPQENKAAGRQGPGNFLDRARRHRMNVVNDKNTPDTQRRYVGRYRTPMRSCPRQPRKPPATGGARPPIPARWGGLNQEGL